MDAGIGVSAGFTLGLIVGLIVGAVYATRVYRRSLIERDREFAASTAEWIQRWGEWREHVATLERELEWCAKYKRAGAGFRLDD